jgi:hypothetical protein
VRFEFISRPPRGNSDIAQYVSEQSPDVLLLSSPEYEELAKRGLLYDLDLLIRRDKYDLDGTIAPVIRYLQNLGGTQHLWLVSGFFEQSLVLQHRFVYAVSNPPAHQFDELERHSASRGALPCRWK